MTTTARKRKMNWKRNTLRIACWNIASWSKRDQEIIIEMNEHKIDICALSETKKKGKGTAKFQNYLLVYSGKNKEDRANAGVGLLIHERLEHCVENIDYHSHRILRVTLKLNSGNINLISVYAPDASKPKEEIVAFYHDLQFVLDGIPITDKVMILGDLNARVGNEIIMGVKQRFNEEVINESGEHLIEFCGFNELRINNTFFHHKDQHKVTWSNTRGHKSTIDYIITNRMIHPTQILDVRALTSANIGSDHNIVLGKIRISALPPKRTVQSTIEKFNIESMIHESTRKLYVSRLKEKIAQNNITNDDDINTSWEKLRTNITKAANEAIGTRKVSLNPTNRTKPWFTEEVKSLAQVKRNAYLKYRSNQTPDQYQEYKVIRNKANADIRDLKRNYWSSFTKDMEHDLYGSQKRIWSMLRRLKKPINEYNQLVNITEEKWLQHFNQLFNKEKHVPEIAPHASNSDEREEFICTPEHIIEAVGNLKTRKATGVDNIPNELLIYGGEAVKDELLQLFQKILQRSDIPEEWCSSITIPILKKGDKNDPSNYRTITLLNSTLKLLTSIIRTEISNKIDISEEQQGFRKNRSTTDAIFIIRQLTEKALEFCKPAYMCFIDLTKAFDRVRLHDVLAILEEKMVSSNIIGIIKAINTNNETTIRLKNNSINHIPINSGIRQGDSLSPLLFNLIMDKIIGGVKASGRGYQLGNEEIKIICYADDAVLIAQDENNLQRLLYCFTKTAEEYNMKISEDKTKCLTIAREPTRCKLVVNNRTIEQVMSFKYLGVNISSHGDLPKEVFSQISKAAAVSGALREVIWHNKFLNTESKVRIYKSCVRPIMTYGIEARADSSKTKRLLRTAEMKILRPIAGKTLRDRVRSNTIREICKVQDVVRWGRQRRRGWNSHVSRMERNRIARIARDGKVHGQRPPGRPHIRWRDSWSSQSQEKTN